MAQLTLPPRTAAQCYPVLVGNSRKGPTLEGFLLSLHMLLSSCEVTSPLPFLVNHVKSVATLYGIRTMVPLISASQIAYILLPILR